MSALFFARPIRIVNSILTSSRGYRYSRRIDFSISCRTYSSGVSGRNDPSMKSTTLPAGPAGKVVDFIDGSFRPDTPEEYVRQEIEKSILREYRYPREEVKIEFTIRMGRAKKRADIVLFPEGAPHVQE